MKCLRCGLEITKWHPATPDAVDVHANRGDCIVELSAANERMRAALEAVEWINELDNNAPRWCPWCDNWQEWGHKPNCQRQAALDAAGG